MIHRNRLKENGLNSNYLTRALKTLVQQIHQEEKISRFGVLREKTKGVNIVHLVTILIAFPLKLYFDLFSFLLFGYWQRHNRVHVSDSSINKEIVLQCLDRLKKLEKECTEISRIPVKTPDENEKLLTGTLERIKSLELDLDKTQSVLHLTLAKQLQITEQLDSHYEEQRKRCCI